MSELKFFRCSTCQVTWPSAVHRHYRYCPGCGHDKVTEVEPPPGARYDGGGVRAAAPIIMPEVNSLVFVPVSITAETYWSLDLVTALDAKLSKPPQPGFQTANNGWFALSDQGKTWRPAPIKYGRFLARLGMSFEQFAMELARGGIEGVTKQSQASLTDWGDHSSARYRGVAQKALGLILSSGVTIEALPGSSDDVGSSAQESAEARVEYLGRWLEAYFPGLTSKEGEPTREAMELLRAMQHRLEAVSMLAGSPVRTGPWISLGGTPISDADLAALAKKGTT